MKTNDLKKGDRVQLRNGWFATMADNKKGNIRMATVEGVFTETGSIYADDITFFFPSNGDVIFLTHTPAQIQARKARAAMGML